MSDKVKFHRMTRPIRFRRLKRVLESVRITYEVGNKKISYLINYILYKLNIIKRINYRTSTDVQNPCVYDGYLNEIRREVSTKCFSGVVKCTLVDCLCTEVDYFYYVDKKGTKKRTYTVVDEERHNYKLVSSFIEPCIIIGDKTYKFGNVPRIFVGLSEPDIPESFPGKSTCTKEAPKPVVYDMTKLLNIGCEIELGNIKISIIGFILESAIEKSVDLIKNYLSGLSLHDLEEHF